MNDIIAKTYCIIGSTVNSKRFDAIVVRIHPINGTYTEVTGNMIACNHEIFHTRLQEEIHNHSPENGEYFFIQEPSRQDRTFNSVMYIADDESIPLSTFTERLLIELVKQGCLIVGIPLLRYHPKTALSNAKAMLLGIRRFQETYTTPLQIYIVVNESNFSELPIIFEQTTFLAHY